MPANSRWDLIRGLKGLRLREEHRMRMGGESSFVVPETYIILRALFMKRKTKSRIQS